MPLRSVLDIAVNDAALDRLQAKLEKYQQTARSLPTVIGPGGPGVGPGARPGARPGRPGETEEERAVPFAERLARAWGQMRDHSREVVRNVREMAQRFLSLTGMLTTLTGVATGFGFLGFNALAGGAAGLRNQAASAFTSIGGLQAARIAFGRFGDVNQMLSGIGAAAQTPGGEGWKALQMLSGRARAMKLPGFDLRPGEDAAELLPQVLAAVQGVMQRTPEQMRGVMFQQLGLDKLFGSFAEAQKLIGRTPEELAAQTGRFGAIRGQLDIPEKSARAFADFMSAIETAGATIKTTLTNQIAALAGPLGELSEQITKLLQALIKWALSDASIAAVSKAIKSLGDTLADPQFQESVKSFIDGIGQAAEAIWHFIQRVGHFFSDTEPVQTPTPGKDPTAPPDRTFPWFNKFYRGGRRFFGLDEGDGTPPPEAPGEAPPPARRPWDQAPPGEGFLLPGAEHIGYRPGAGRGVPVFATAPLPVEITGFRGFGDRKEEPEAPKSPWDGMLRQADFRLPADNDNGAVTPDLLSRIAKVESGFNPLAVSPAGAMGMMQFMPGTWQRFGHGSPFDPAEAIAAAKRYLGYLFNLPELGGDPAKVVASYNAGENRVIAAIRQFGPEWRSHLPAETQRYIPNVLGGAIPRPDFHPPRPPQLQVLLQNEAGGNLVVSSRKLA